MAKEKTEYQVVVKGQIDQMAQYGQVLVATAGVMMSVIGGLVVVQGPKGGAVWFGISVALLAFSLFSGFLGYGYVVNSFFSPIPYEEFKDNATQDQMAHSADLKLAGSEAVLVKKSQFKSIRTWAFIQFFSMLLGSVLFLVGFVT